MPLQATSGAASYDAFGGGVPVPKNYIEDVFSTWLYTGNGSTQTITNGIDLSTKGGMTWIKTRSNTVSSAIYDTNRGALKLIGSNTTNAESNGSSGMGLSSFNTTGFSLDADTVFSRTNVSGLTYTSWTFRKQPKFFDVVTYTGTGVGRTIAHNLGSVPGFIIVKRTDASADWQVYHRSLANTQYMVLNSTAAVATGTNRWNSTTPTDTVFSLGTDASVNASGGTYVAYLFAHNAGGFGLTGTDNVISCGSYTGTGTDGNFISLGYEPQWVLIKKTNEAYNWSIFDNMRGVATGGSDAILYPNVADAEVAPANVIDFNATGFTANTGFAWTNDAGDSYIYIAIRRGPMKVPTTGTSVFSPNLTTTGQNNGTILTTGFPLDLQIIANTVNSNHKRAVTRLTGVGTVNENPLIPYLETTNTNAETTDQISRDVNNTGYRIPSMYGNNAAIYWNFRRAPGFFDVVCYTGTGTEARTVAHNLGTAPELVIIKRRSGATQWGVGTTSIGWNYLLSLNTTNGRIGPDPVSYWGNTAPTSTVFTVGDSLIFNGSGSTYVAYLFATCLGVSKVGSYTGTGTTQTINCGFAAGARFVLIKRTDSTGDWYVWDSARGIVAGNDPYLLLNSTAAEVTSTDYIDTASTGFEISSTAPAAINASGGSFIFLAIA
jgi:hypothetical protein